MIISHVKQSSTEEFAGNTSLVLYCQGCNLKCRNCCNYKTIIDEKLGSFEQILFDKLSHIDDAIVITGGEPTIWREKLIKNCELEKSTWGLPIKIFTNGGQPEVVEELVGKKLVDAFSVDLKAIHNVYKTIGVKIPDSDYLINIHRTLSLIEKSKLPCEIRTVDLDTIDIEEVRSYVKINYPKFRHVVVEDIFKQVQ